VKLSIVIPAYNASKTLLRCLDSIFAVGLEEDSFEVIVVDDCSTDNTLQLLQDYAVKQPNIRVIHQTVNKRQGAARNCAVAIAAGEYIAFVDADDEVTKGLGDALSHALLTRVDMQYCSVETVDDRGVRIERYSIDLSDAVVLKGTAFLNDFYKTRFCAYPWAWLYRRQFLVKSNCPFVEGRVAEDMDWIEQHLVLAERVGCFSGVIYRYYVQHVSSSTHIMNWKYEADRMQMVMRRLKLMESVKDELPQYANQVREDCYHLQKMRWRLRRLSKYSPSFYWHLISATEDEVLPFLRKYKWSACAEFCQNYKFVTLAFLCVLFPIGKISRGFIAIIR